MVVVLEPESAVVEEEIAETAIEPVTELLIKARELLSDPHRWHRGCLARNFEGSCHPCHTNAMSWCAMGALMNRGGGEVTPLVRRAAIRLTQAAVALTNGHANLISFNDALWHNHADIMRMFDEAIALD